MQKREYEIMYQVEDTHFWFKGMRAILQTLISRLPLPPHAQILDAGCGTGINILSLQRFGRVSGMDYSAHAVRFCRRRGLTVKQGSINKLPYAANSFDLVTCLNVFDEQPVKEKITLAEFRRVLKPGGHLLILVPAYQWLHSSHDISFHTARRYTTTSLAKLMRASKLRVVHSTYANTVLFPLQATKRLARKYLPFFFTAHKSDVDAVHPLLNFVLYLPLLLESLLLRYFNLPFGLSVIVIARKHK